MPEDTQGKPGLLTPEAKLAAFWALSGRHDTNARESYGEQMEEDTNAALAAFLRYHSTEGRAEAVERAAAITAVFDERRFQCDRCGTFGRLDPMGGPAHHIDPAVTTPCPECSPEAEAAAIISDLFGEAPSE